MTRKQKAATELVKLGASIATKGGSQIVELLRVVAGGRPIGPLIDENNRDWLYDVALRLEHLSKRVEVVAASAAEAARPWEATALAFQAYDAATKTAQEFKRDCLRRAVVSAFDPAWGGLDARETLLHMICQLSDLDLQLLAELARHVAAVVEPSRLPEDNAIGVTPSEIETTVTGVPDAAARELVGNALGGLVSRRMLVDLVEFRAKMLAGVSAFDAEPTVREPRYVLSELGKLVVQFAVEERADIEIDEAVVPSRD